MKATEFIKKYGVDEAIYFIKKYGSSKTTFKFFKVNENSLSVHSGDQPYDFHIDDLKRLIESHYLIKDLGGPIVAKRIADQAKQDNFNYMYRNIKLAIADVESCQ